MTASQNRERQLEAFVADTVRRLPLRRAPQTLEARVLAQLAPRAWWHRSFPHWPLAARAVFLIACGGCAKLAFMAIASAAAGLHSIRLAATTTAPVNWMTDTAAIATAVRDSAALLLHAIPPHLLYGGLAVAAVMYAALIGLGSFAYHTLVVRK